MTLFWEDITLDEDETETWRLDGAQFTAHLSRQKGSTDWFLTAPILGIERMFAGRDLDALKTDVVRYMRGRARILIDNLAVVEEALKS